MNTKNFESQMYHNNTFDLDILHKVYDEVMSENFHTLYDVQKTQFSIYNKTLRLKDFKLETRLHNSVSHSNSKKLTYWLDYSFVDQKDRLKYNRDNKFNRLMDRIYISKNHDTFKHNYLCYINGVEIKDVDVLINGDKCMFVLYIKEGLETRGITEDFYRNNLESLVNIIIVPNYTLSTDNKNPVIWDKHLTVKPTNHNNRYFQLTNKLPVPTENILVYKVDTATNNIERFCDYISVELYYPNIYHLKGAVQNEVYKMYIFYNTDLDDNNPVYTNSLDLFHRFSSDVISQYKSASIPEIVRDYKPLVFDYSIDNYTSSVYKPSRLSYKIAKMQKFIDKDPYILSKYLAYQCEKRKKYFIDCSNIDLYSRLRTDTSLDIPDSDTVTFDTEHYVFSLKSILPNMDNYTFRLFIDGLFNMNCKIFPGIDFFYIYIPTTDVSSASIIEVNKMFKYSYSDTFTLSSLEDSYTCNLYEKVKQVRFTELEFIDVETGNFMLHTDFILSTEVNGSMLEIDTHGERFIDKLITIKLRNESYLNKVIKIRVDKQDKTEVITMTQQGKIEVPTSVVKRDPSTYRLFRGDKHLPHVAYNAMVGINETETTDVLINLESTVGETFILDATTDRYYDNLFIRTIDNPKGFLDLTGKIDKPLDLKWYDMYLNGQKLNKSNIEIISPTKMFIKNVSSLKNFLLQDINRDEEVLKLSDVYCIDDWTFDNINEIRENVLNSMSDIQDTAEDILRDLVEYCVSDDYTFFIYFMKYTFIDPNMNQITRTHRLSFPNLFKCDGILKLDPNKDPDGREIMRVFPELTEDGSPVDETISYTKEVGGMDDRFAVALLKKSNMQFALPGELTCDDVTGSIVLKREDGDIISLDEASRYTIHCNKLTDWCSMNGMLKGNIYSMQPDNVSYPMNVLYNTNLLDAEIDITNIVNGYIIVSLDLLGFDIVNNVYTVSENEPNVTLEYEVNSQLKTVTKPLSYFNTYKIQVFNDTIKLKSLTVTPNGSDNNKLILYSVLAVI